MSLRGPTWKFLQLSPIFGAHFVFPSELPGGIADGGAPVLVLALHPTYRQAFDWSCEGLGEWKDRPAWIVRFSQKPDRPTVLLSTFETLTQR